MIPPGCLLVFQSTNKEHHQKPNFRSKLQFDGMLLDENEPTTVSNGAVGGCSTTDPYDNSIYSLSKSQGGQLITK